jgi:HK97 family phage major capsid protein
MAKGKDLIECKQERATITTNIRAIMDEFDGKPMDAIKKEELTKLEARFDELNEAITAEEKQLERERIIGESQNNDHHQKKDARLDEAQAAFRDYLITGSKQSFEVYAALQQSNPTQAGYLVAPEKFATELISELADATFMRKKARVLDPLSGAQSLGFPVRTAGMSSFAWGTEISAPTADTSLAYGKREFKPRPGTSEILISKTLVRNVANADALVRGEIVEEIGKAYETAYMTGDGALGPLGLFTASVDGIPASRDVSTGNTQTEIKFDGLFEAKYAVKDQYQAGCEWIFNRAGVKQIAKLKDGEGQYIWQPSVVAGTPDLLLGKPVNSSEFAPAVFTAGLYVGIYGNLKYYWICDSLAMEIQVLMELYARTNQVDYMTRIETDGAPVLPAAFARVKLA